MSLSRRRMLQGSLAAVAAAQGLLSSRSWAQSGQVVFTATGGTWQENARKAWLNEFEKATGVKVVDVVASPVLPKLQAMVEAGNVEWDLMDLDQSNVGLAAERNLIEKIDYSIVKTDGLPKSAYGEYSVSYGFYSTNLIYNPKKFAGRRAPRGWADYWNVKDFPGTRALRNNPTVNLEAALIADGVPRDKLYPLDLDRAFRSLDRIKPHIKTWWTTGAQSIQLVADGEIDIGTTWNSRAINAKAAGRDVELSWTDGSLHPLVFVVAKGAKNKANAMRLISFIIEAKSQARMADLNKDAPSNVKAMEFIDPNVAKLFPTYPTNLAQMFVFDDPYWVKNRPAITERFTKWLAS